MRTSPRRPASAGCEQETETELKLAETELKLNSKDEGTAMSKTIAHHCHAIGCEKACPPERLMCAAHWRKVPRAQQLAVWANYRRGQCDDKKPSSAWMGAARAAIGAVAAKEGKQEAFDAWIARQEALATALAGIVNEALASAAGAKENEKESENSAAAAQSPDASAA